MDNIGNLLLRIGFAKKAEGSYMCDNNDVVNNFFRFVNGKRQGFFLCEKLSNDFVLTADYLQSVVSLSVCSEKQTSTFNIDMRIFGEYCTEYLTLMRTNVIENLLS